VLQALIGNPESVIPDEPTAGLDPVVANDIRTLIKTHSQSTTTIISSHNLYEIQALCTHVVVLDKGRLVANGPISDLVYTEAELNFTLDSPPSAELHAGLTQLVEIKELIYDEVNKKKITMVLNTEQADDLHIQIQTIFNEYGFSIMQMNRGQRAVEGMLDLIEKDI